MADNILLRLCSQDKTAFYWIGFLLADGHFRRNEVSLEISKRDVGHLELFLQYLDISTDIITERSRGLYEMVAISLTDARNVPHILKTFQISSNKSKNPPDLRAIRETIGAENMFCLIAGIIDGDGHIRQVGKNMERSQIALEMHGLWLHNLCFIEDFVYEYLNMPRTRRTGRMSKLNKRGHSRLVISSSGVIKKIKLTLQSFSIPIMERKWANINSNDMTFTEQTEQRVNLIRSGITNRVRLSSIATSIGITAPAVRSLIKHYLPEYLAVLPKGRWDEYKTS